jgi:CheY-like chemotaxis protein
MRLALRHHDRLKIVAELCDGQEAIKYLTGHGGFGDRKKYPFPDLMLLDLKMPRVTGYEVLQWLQTQAFDDLTVVVVSGSILPEDIHKCLELGADAYHVKESLKEPQERMLREILKLLERRRSNKKP